MSNVVLIHGLWMTPLCWEHWVARYEAAGHTVHAPAWPGRRHRSRTIRRDPSALAPLGVKEITDHYEAYHPGPRPTADHHGPLLRRPRRPAAARPGRGRRRRVDRPRAAQGHLPPPALLAAGGVRCAAQPGQPQADRRAVAQAVPLRLRQPAQRGRLRRRARPLRHPGPGPAALPGGARERHPPRRHHGRLRQRQPSAAAADRRRRGPRLPASVTKAAFKRHSKSKAKTELKVYPGRSHDIVGEPGWEAVADHALDWAERNAVS